VPSVEHLVQTVYCGVAFCVLNSGMALPKMSLVYLIVHLAGLMHTQLYSLALSYTSCMGLNQTHCKLYNNVTHFYLSLLLLDVSVTGLHSRRASISLWHIDMPALLLQLVLQTC
jgi:hypothetical protein